MRRAIKILAVCALVSLCGQAASARAADDATETLNAIDETLLKAGELLRGKKADEAAAALADAKTRYTALKEGKIPAELRPRVDRVGERLEAAERLIAKAKNPPAASDSNPAGNAGTKPPAGLPAKSGAMPTAKKGAIKSAKGAKSKSNRKGPPAGPSFTTDIAPILIARCGNCHVRNARGGLSMATFAALEKGTKEAPVIRPGSSDGSRIVEVILSGDMPRGGGKVEPQELAAIVRWIDSGALFDSADRNAPIGKPAGDSGAPAVARATGSETVQFNRDLAPVLLAACVECHGGDQPAGQLGLETFASLMKGGATGELIDLKKPTDSLLLKRLRGEDGDRMPKDKPPLADNVIAQLETWIKEGAKFDGDDVSQPLKVAVERLLAGQMTHEELSAKRLAQATKLWALGMPDEQPEQVQTANFLLIGNLSSARMAEIADLAEGERTKIVKLLKLDADAPLVKGRLVLFVLKRSFDYSEFVRMVEERESPRGAQSHVRHKGSDAYACFVAPNDADAGLGALVAEQVAAGYLQSLKDVPPWFIAGAARAIAARVEPRSPRVKQWDADLRQPSVAGAAAADDGFLSATVFDGATAAHSYSFVRSLMTNPARFNALISALGEGHPFGSTLQDTYRANARTLVEMWRRQKPPGRG